MCPQSCSAPSPQDLIDQLGDARRPGHGWARPTRRPVGADVLISDPASTKVVSASTMARLVLDTAPARAGVIATDVGIAGDPFGGEQTRDL